MLETRNTEQLKSESILQQLCKKGLSMLLPFWEVLNHWNHASSRTNALSRNNKISSLSPSLNFSVRIPLIRSGKNTRQHGVDLILKPCSLYGINKRHRRRFLPRITKSSVGGLPLLGYWTTYCFGILLQEQKLKINNNNKQLMMKTFSLVRV